MSPLHIHVRDRGPGHLRRLLWLVELMCVVVSVSLPAAAHAADVEAGQRQAEVCVPCHGVGGNSTNPAIPSLAGQLPLYTYYQLLMFRGQQRVDPQMAPIVAKLSDAAMQDLAAYYAVQTLATPHGPGDPAKAAAGEKLVRTYHCDSCHAPGLVGQKHIPRLAGQHYAYLLHQLRGFKAQTRADLEGSMTMAAQPLSQEDIEMLAHYIAHLR